jgi:hypothetical protein
MDSKHGLIEVGQVSCDHRGVSLRHEEARDPFDGASESNQNNWTVPQLDGVEGVNLQEHRIVVLISVHHHRIDTSLASQVRCPHDGLLVEKGSPVAGHMCCSESSTLPDQLPLHRGDESHLTPSQHKRLWGHLQLAGGCRQATPLIVAKCEAAPNGSHIPFLIVGEVHPRENFDLPKGVRGVPQLFLREGEREDQIGFFFERK